jgi:hypothetical protein
LYVEKLGPSGHKSRNKYGKKKKKKKKKRPETGAEKKARVGKGLGG